MVRKCEGATMTSSIKSLAARQRCRSFPFIGSDKQSHISIDKSRVMTEVHASRDECLVPNGMKTFFKRGSTQVLVQSGDSILSCEVAPHLEPPRGMMLILTSLTNSLGGRRRRNYPPAPSNSMSPVATKKLLLRW